MCWIPRVMDTQVETCARQFRRESLLGFLHHVDNRAAGLGRYGQVFVPSRRLAEDGH